MTNISTIDCIENLYKKNTNLFIIVISGIKDLPITFIEQLKNILDWSSLSACSIHCNNFHFIEKYENFINWKIIKHNESLVWSEELYLKYKTFVNEGEEYKFSDEQITYHNSKFDFINHSPWNEKLFNKYITIVDWWVLSMRTDINWTIDFIEKNKENLSWSSLSSNPSLPWSIDFIEYFKDYWLWETYDSDVTFPEFGILQNQNILWDNTLIKKFSKKIPWSELSNNNFIIWTEDLIADFIDLWDWRLLSRNDTIPWSETLIIRFIENWDLYELFNNNSFTKLFWADEFKKYLIFTILNGKYNLNYSSLSKVSDIIWNENLILKFCDKINWWNLSFNESLKISEEFIIQNLDTFLIDKDKTQSTRYLKCAGLSMNNSIPWSKKLLKANLQIWNWGFLSVNQSLPWSIEFIKEFENYWHWKPNKYSCSINSYWSGYAKDYWENTYFNCSLSSNSALPWSKKFILLFYDKWDWTELSKNKSLPWSIDFISSFIDDWEWSELSKNSSIPWSAVLIKTFEHMWNWDELSKNCFLNWNNKLINNFKDKWNWQLLSMNQNISINIELLQNFKDKWDWNKLNNKWSCESIEIFISTGMTPPHSLIVFLRTHTNINIITKTTDELTLKLSTSR